MRILKQRKIWLTCFSAIDTGISRNLNFFHVFKKKRRIKPVTANMIVISKMIVPPVTRYSLGSSCKSPLQFSEFDRCKTGIL